jgi:putative ABC transport system permease protein
VKYGRNFSSDLRTDIKGTCILNEEACRAFGIENPVGKLLGNIEIIGVVYNFNFTSLHNAIEPLVMNYGSGKIVQIKVSAERQDATVNYIKSICKNLSPDFECNYSFLDSRIRQLYKPDLDLKSSFAVYSIITLIIAVLGLFGLTLFTVKKKIKEVIIRKLFGARLKDTINLLTREHVIIVIISNILAMPITLLIMHKWLDNFRYKIDISFLIFLETFLITIVFTLLTVLFFILKTHRLNLIDNLKHE